MRYIIRLDILRAGQKRRYQLNLEEGQRFTIDERSPGLDLQDSDIPPNSVYLAVHQGQLLIHSRTATVLLNHEAFEKATLRQGDRLSIGDRVIEFHAPRLATQDPPQVVDLRDFGQTQNLNPAEEEEVEEEPQEHEEVDESEMPTAVFDPNSQTPATAAYTPEDEAPQEDVGGASAVQEVSREIERDPGSLIFEPLEITSITPLPQEEKPIMDKVVAGLAVTLILGGGSIWLFNKVSPSSISKEEKVFNLARSHKTKAIRDLLSEDVIDPNLKIQGEVTLLMVAAGKGYQDMVEVLFLAGADLNAQDTMGRSALYWASQEGHADTAYYLLSKGANPKLKNKAGVTAFESAKKNRRDAVVKMFQAGPKGRQPASKPQRRRR